MTSPACSDAAAGAPRLARPRASATLCAAALLAANRAPQVARAFEPFVVRDIRVEGVQRTEAGTVFSYLPIKVGERVDDEKAAAAVKALFATGFFRDVRLEAQDGVLVVIVQERPTISKIDIRRQQGIRHRHAQEGAEGHRHRRGADLRPLGARPRRAGNEAPVHHARRATRRRCTTTVTPQERNRVAINFTIVEGDSAKIARINIVGNKAFTEAQLLDEMQLTTPGLARPGTRRTTSTRSRSSQPTSRRCAASTRTAATSSSTSSRRRCRSRRTRKTSTSRSTSARASRTRCPTCASRATCRCRATSSRRLIRSSPGETISREQAAGDGQGDQRPAGRRRLRVRQRQRGARGRPREAQVAFTIYVDPGRRVYVRKINISGNAQDARRGDPARDAPARERLVRRRAHRALEGADHAPRLFRRRQRRDAAGARHDRPGRRRRDRGREDHGQPAGRRRLFELRRCRVQRVGLAAEHLRHRQRADRAAINTSKINRTISLAFTEPYWTVDGISRTFELYQKNIDPTARCGLAVRVVDAGRRGRLRRPDQRNRSRSMSGFRVEHTNLSLFDNSPPALLRLRPRVRLRRPTATSCRGGWSRDTRDDILYPTKGTLQSAIGEVGLPFGDLAYYKLQLPATSTFWPVYGDFVLMLRGDVGLRRRIRRQAAAVLQGVLRGRRRLGARLRYGARSGPRTSTATRLGGKRKIVGNAELFYPAAEGRQVGARERVLRRRADLRQRRRRADCTSNSAIRTGVGVAWNSPIGPLKFSYAHPAQREVGRQDPALPVPGRHRVLTGWHACGEFT